jgi:hypothetical protein
MNRKLPGQWTGRSGPINWPPRSFDSNPLDFYIWSHLRSLVYSSTLNYVETLKSICGRFSDDTQHARNLELPLGAMRRQTDAHI